MTHSVEKSHIEKTCKTALAYHQKSNSTDDASKKFQDTIEGPEKILLQISFTAVPQLKNKSFYFNLPKSPVFDEETSEVCVITKNSLEKDPVSGNKVSPKEHQGDLKRLFKASEVMNFVTEVLPVGLLKTDYKTHEQKRILANSYDFYVADRDVMNVVPGILGTNFLRNKKMPRKINNLDPENIKLRSKIVEALSQAHWFVDGRGDCTSIIVGSTEFTEEELIKNVEKCLDEVAKNSPRGWGFIRSVHLKLEKSLSLSVYKKDSKDDKVTALSKLEEHSNDREEVKGSGIQTLYDTLNRDNRKLKRKAEKAAEKAGDEKSVEASKTENSEEATAKVSAKPKAAKLNAKKSKLSKKVAEKPAKLAASK